MAREASRLVKEQVARLKPVQKAAVLLHALSNDVIREVSRNLTESEVRALLPEMNRFPNSSSVETVGVVNEFLHIHKMWQSLGRSVLNDGQAMLEALQRWATRNPRRVAALLRESWLSGRT
jgi:flagellar motor switch protein FliG